MRAAILLTALPLAAACAVSSEVTPYPPDARPGSIDASGPGPGPAPDASPVGGDAGSPIDAMRSTLAIGWLGASTSQTLITAETLFALRLPRIDGPVSLVGWGVGVAVQSDTQVRMALYTDNSGTPGDLVTWTDAWPISDGVHSDDGDPLEPGEYWLVLLVREDVEIGQEAGESVDACLQSWAFDASFETSFSSASCTPLDALNIYILVEEAN